MKPHNYPTYFDTGWLGLPTTTPVLSLVPLSVPMPMEPLIHNLKILIDGIPHNVTFIIR